MRESRGIFRLLVILSASLGYGCRTAEPVPDYDRPLPPGEVALELVTDPAEYPDFSVDDGGRESLIAAIDNSLDYLSRPSSEAYFPYLTISHERVVASLRAFREIVAGSPDPRDWRARVERDFDVYRSKGWNGKGGVLFTGYCQPIYEARLQRGGPFQVPLYRLPPDLVKTEDGTCLGRRLPDGSIAPYWTRTDIDGRRVLEGKGLELCWVQDPFQAYVIHVQGSAKLILEGGREFSIGYAGKNEHPYRSIGEILIRDGRIRKDELSLTTLERYFARHPEAYGILEQNPSYVFFTEREGGPYGSLNVPVTAHRSIATDKAVFPRAAVAFFDAPVPVIAGATVSFRRRGAFVLDQDTGGAIRSAGRCDIFFGIGDQAKLFAGHARAEGKLFYIFLKDVPAREVAGSPGPARSSG
ncbi:MAG: MltA domain-containing protein [Planctomycetes bacterium]|nr:MltA domain-containing protein [Planctomycetota bacterium]